MRSTVSTPVNLTASRILSAPLPELLVEAGAQLVDSSIPDEKFLGAVVQRGDGSLLLSMPAGRDSVERSVIARGLIANALGVDLAPFPSPLETSGFRVHEVAS